MELIKAILIDRYLRHGLKTPRWPIHSMESNMFQGRLFPYCFNVLFVPLP